MTEHQDSSKIPEVLTSLGMSPIDQACPYLTKDCSRVVLDGRVLGFILDCDAKKIVDRLRLMKVNNDKVRTILIEF